MSAMAIVPVAGDKFGRKFKLKELLNWIESVVPAEALQMLDEGWARIDTTNGRVIVTARPAIEAPTGAKLFFQGWRVGQPGGTTSKTWPDRAILFSQGEADWAGLFYADLVIAPRQVLTFPPRDEEQIDLFVDIMMRHFPHWEPPQPLPAKARAPELAGAGVAQ